MAQLIPVSNAPNQTMTVSLLVNGAILSLGLRIYYNSQGKFWMMDVSDKVGNPIVSSVSLMTGVWPAANILGPYGYLKIGSAFLINQNGAVTDWPDNTNLGNGYIFLWDDNTDA